MSWSGFPLRDTSPADLGVARGGEGEFVPLTPIRRRASQALTESKRSIPHSYVSVWIAADEVEARVQAEARRLDVMLSVSTWLVACVAQEPVLIRGQTPPFPPRAGYSSTPDDTLDSRSTRAMATWSSP